METVLPQDPGAVFEFNLTKLFYVLLVGVATYGLTVVTRFALGQLAERIPQRRLLFKRLEPILGLLLYFVAFYAAIKIISPEQASLYAILGSMALSLGLAAKDLLNDFIGGIVVLFDRPFQVGDRVAAGGHYGEVTSIGLRSTKLVTPDDSLVTVPNSAILSSSVSNSNAGAMDAQVAVDVRLPAGIDLDRVEAIARQAALTSRLAYLAKPVVVNVRDEFEETSLTRLVVKAYVFDARYENAFAADLTRRIKKELALQGLVPADVRFGWPVGTKAAD